MICIDPHVQDAVDKLKQIAKSQLRQITDVRDTQGKVIKATATSQNARAHLQREWTQNDIIAQYNARKHDKHIQLSDCKRQKHVDTKTKKHAMIVFPAVSMSDEDDDVNCLNINRDHIVNAGVCRNASRLPGTYMRDAFCPFPQDACVRFNLAGGGYSRYSAPCAPIGLLLPAGLGHVDLFSIDVEEHVMDVLHTFPWGRVSVDVVLAECRGAKLEKRCIKLLRQRGFHPLQLRLGGDVLAVRKACVS